MTTTKQLLKEKIYAANRGEFDMQIREIKPDFVGEWRQGNTPENLDWILRMMDKGLPVEFDGTNGEVDDDGWITEFRFYVDSRQDFNLAQL